MSGVLAKPFFLSADLVIIDSWIEKQAGCSFFWIDWGKSNE